MFDKELFLKNVFSVADKNNMPISILEKRIDVSAGYLVKLRNDDTRKNVTADIMIKISEVLGVSIDYLCKVDCDGLTRDEINVLSFFEKIKKNTLNNKYKWKEEDAEYIQLGQGLIGGAISRNNEYGHTFYVSAFRNKVIDPVDESYYAEIQDNIYFVIVSVSGETSRTPELESYIVKYVGKRFETSKVCATCNGQPTKLDSALKDLYKVAEESGKKIELDEKTSKFISDFIRD